MHLPVFVNWIITHDNDDCGYRQGCMACYLSELAEDYWYPGPDDTPGFIVKHDYKLMKTNVLLDELRRETKAKDVPPAKWRDMNADVQSDSHEFLNWLVSDALPWFFDNVAKGYGTNRQLRHS
jgi:hypothetical protein